MITAVRLVEHHPFGRCVTRDPILTTKTSESTEMEFRLGLVKDDGNATRQF